MPATFSPQIIPAPLSPQTTAGFAAPANAAERAEQYRTGFKFLRDYAERRIIPYNDMRQAQMFLRNLIPYFQSNGEEIKRLAPELYAEWQHLFVMLKWVNFQSLRENDILDLIENHFAEMYEVPGYDLEGKFTSRMIAMFYRERDGFKKKVRDALLRNAQTITEGEVVRGTHEESGTVQNWLLDYNEKLGTDKVESIAFADYLANSQNTHSLNEDDRDRVEILFSFYERLKYSSLTIEGMEDEVPYLDPVDGKLKVLSEGEIVEIKDVKLPDFPPEVIEEFKKSGYDIFGEGAGSPPPAPSFARRGELNLPQPPPSQGGGKSSSPYEGLSHLRMGSKEGVEGSGMISFPSPYEGEGRVGLVSDQEMLSKYSALPVSITSIREKIAELSERSQQNPQLVSIILSRPKEVRDPAYAVAAIMLSIHENTLGISEKNKLKLYIREFLERELGWSAADSAKLGIRIGMLLGGEYREWAYYNKSSGEFEWEKIGK